MIERLNVFCASKKELLEDTTIFKLNTLIFESDTGRYKKGNNVQPYRDLLYTKDTLLLDKIKSLLDNANHAHGVPVLDQQGTLVDKVLPSKVVTQDDTIFITAGNKESILAMHQ